MIQVKPLGDPQTLFLPRPPPQSERRRVARQLFASDSANEGPSIKELLKQEQKEKEIDFCNRYALIEDNYPTTKNIQQKELREDSAKCSSSGERETPYTRKPKASITEYYSERKKKVCCSNTNSRMNDVHSQGKNDKRLQNSIKENAELENISDISIVIKTSSVVTTNESSPTS